MKKIIFIIFIISNSLFSQKSSVFENKNVNINYKKNIKIEKIWITLSQPYEENITFFNLFQDKKFSEEKSFLFPNKSGYYYLSIIYDLKLQYREIIYYNENPANEKLSFYFYCKKGNVYCKINSNQFNEINKTVQLYNIDYEMIKKNLREQKNKNFKK